MKFVLPRDLIGIITLVHHEIEVERIYYSDRDIWVLGHPNPNWEVHFVVIFSKN